LADDLPLGRRLPEEEGSEGNDEYQPRRERKDRVKREGGAKSRRAILVPLEEGLSEKRPGDARG
jgi:hypothetical protein